MIENSYTISKDSHDKNFSFSPLELCREDIEEEDARCFLKNNLFAHTTTKDRLDSIKEKGIIVMNTDKRIHKNFDEILKKECE